MHSLVVLHRREQPPLLRGVSIQRRALLRFLRRGGSFLVPDPGQLVEGQLCRRGARAEPQERVEVGL